jgi:hypothetical protein
VKTIRRRAVGSLRADVLTALYLLSGHRFPEGAILGIIRQEELMESATYRATIERGRAQGRVEGTAAVVLAQLAHRLGQEASSLAPRLALCDEAVLTRIATMIIDISDPVTLRREVEALLPA